MIWKEQDVVVRRSLLETNDSDPHQWGMVFGPAQQAVQLDLGLYTITALLQKDENLQLFLQPKPAWCVESSDNHGILAHLGTAKDMWARLLSDSKNSWLPVFFLKARNTENDNWCTVLEVGVGHPPDLEAHQNELCKEVKIGKGELEIFLGVSSSRYEAEIKGEGASGMDEVLAVHPNSAVGMTRKYGPGLAILVTFTPAKDDSDARRWAT